MIMLPHAANREVVNLFSLVFFGEAIKCDVDFLCQDLEGVFVFSSQVLGLSFRGFSFSLQACFAFSLLLTSFQSFSWSSFFLPFLWWPSLVIRLFTLAFSCSLSRSSFFGVLSNPFRVFLDSLPAF